MQLTAEEVDTQAVPGPRHAVAANFCERGLLTRLSTSSSRKQANIKCSCGSAQEQLQALMLPYHIAATRQRGNSGSARAAAGIGHREFKVDPVVLPALAPATAPAASHSQTELRLSLGVHRW